MTGGAMSRIAYGTGAFRRTTLALFAGGFVTFLTLYDVQPLLPLFCREFRVPPTIGTLPLSLATGALAVAMLVAGALSESLGRKPVMAAALLLTSLLALVTAFSTSFPALLTLRLLQGVVLAGLPAVGMAYLSEEMDSSAVGAAMGLYISGNAVGGMSGRLFTAAVTDLFSWRAALGAIGVICLVLTLVFIRSLPPSAHVRPRPFAVRHLLTPFAAHLGDPGLLSLFAISFLAMGGFVTLYNYVTFRLLAPPYGLTQTAVSLIFLVYLLGSCSSSLAGRLSDRFGRETVLRAGLAVMLLGTAVTLARPLAAIVGGVALFTCGFFGVHAVASGWVGQRARTARAQAASLYLFAYYLGSSLSGSLGGFLWMRFGWEGVAALIAFLAVVALFVALRLARISPAGAEAGDGAGDAAVAAGG